MANNEKKISELEPIEVLKDIDILMVVEVDNTGTPLLSRTTSVGSLMDFVSSGIDGYSKDQTDSLLNNIDQKFSNYYTKSESDNNPSHVHDYSELTNQPILPNPNDFASSIHLHSYNDLTDQLEVATTSVDGLLSYSDKVKIDGIEDNSQHNVQADWLTTDNTSDSYIKNKPTIPTNFALSSHDHTDATVTKSGFMSKEDKDKLDSIDDGAEQNVQSDWNALSGSPAYIKNKPQIPVEAADKDHSHSLVTTTDNGFMSKTDKTKLDSVSTGANVNVKPDWNATSGDSEILNKPTIPTSDDYADKNHTHEYASDTHSHSSSDLTDGTDLLKVGPVIDASPATTFEQAMLNVDPGHIICGMTLKTGIYTIQCRKVL